MALEDRCSPPGAQSPTGIPQSPASSTSPSPPIHYHHHQQQSITNTRNLFFNNFRRSPSAIEMSPHVSKTELPSPTSSPHHHRIHQHHHDDDDDERTTTTMKFKEELNTSTHSNDEESGDETSQDGGATPAVPISFSICNILSENFGKLKHKSKSSAVLFRPYDLVKSSGVESKKSPSSYCNAVDYSNRQKEIFEENIFKLSATNYPRIHEEVYNSQKYGDKNQPLGALSKTISQIGQTIVSSVATVPMARNTFSPKSESGFSGLSSQLPLQRNDSGVESSDDTRSESGSTKDENGQVWPAWVFCTRYSDRPSSG